MTPTHAPRQTDAGPTEVVSQLVADEIVLLSTGMRVDPTGTALDVLMHALEERLGSRAAAQQWLLTPRGDLAGKSAADVVARDGKGSVPGLVERLAG